eukprot:gb/GFBE01068337.1/.p1 GENE.gb/GFBE01068337.1/~~gb/GFBE01068337.1/.p1  ORF type:complete len:265 (+),score=56.98 gb/GFBE01068337.1/:1-795(+)
MPTPQLTADHAPVETIPEQDAGLPLPTLLQMRSQVREPVSKASAPDEKQPTPQVLGAILVEDEDDMSTQEHTPEAADGSPLPPHRKAQEDIEKEEAFWSKAQEALEDRTRRERLLQFLKAHRFKDVNSSSGWFFNYRFPLHAAVEQNDASMVNLLMHFKAKTKLKDANGLTARQLARRRNASGDYDQILKIFSEHAAGRRKRAAARRAAREARAAAMTAAGAADAIPREVPVESEDGTAGSGAVAESTTTAQEPGTKSSGADGI